MELEDRIEQADVEGGDHQLANEMAQTLAGLSTSSPEEIVKHAEETATRLSGDERNWRDIETVAGMLMTSETLEYHEVMEELGVEVFTRWPAADVWTPAPHRPAAPGR